MRILINDGSRCMNIRIPSGIIFNHVIATVAGPAIVAKIAEKNGAGEVSLDSRAVRAIFKEVNRCRRSMPDWSLVEVESGGNMMVQIQL